MIEITSMFMSFLEIFFFQNQQGCHIMWYQTR